LPRHRDERATITRRDTEPGDHVDLLALVDVLAVPNVCGADVMRTSNFALKPIRVTPFEATDEDMVATPKTPNPKLSQTKYSYFQNLCYHSAFPEKRGMSHGTDSNTRATA
jgi:hypothetical protein